MGYAHLSLTVPLLNNDNVRSLFDSIANRIYTVLHRKQFAHFGRQSYLGWKALHLRGLSCISIGDRTYIEPHVQLTTWTIDELPNHKPNISIGNDCLIRYGAHITAVNSICIGDNLLTGTNVLITDNSHGETKTTHLQMPPLERPIISKGPVVIGNNVWLGNNVCIMPNVTIGDGAVIGANSVVTTNIPAFSVAVGCPARVVKQNNY